MSELLELLTKFTTQAHQGNDLSIPLYPKTFRGLKCDVSFGKGTRADVAWISLYQEGQALPGHFPSFYYDWRNSLLFSVLGVSEKDHTKQNWPPDLLDRYPEFAVIEESPIVAKRYPRSRRYARYSIDPDNIPGSLGDQIAAIENDLDSMLKLYHDSLPPPSVTLEEMLKPYIAGFKEQYPDLEQRTGDGERTGSELRKWMTDRVQHAFSRENINSLDEDEAIDILSNFWSIKFGGGGGGGKTDEFGRSMTAVDLVKREHFVEKAKDLLYGETPFPERYSRFLEIKGVGRGTASELLSYYDPKEYGIINTPSEEGLFIFGLERRAPVGGKKAGEFALSFFGKLKLLLSILKKDPFFADADLQTLDYFLYFVSDEFGIWRIAGGENGTRWEDRTWQTRGIASFVPTGIEQALKEDVLTADEARLRETYRELYPRRRKKSEDETVEQLSTFLHEVNVGDVLVANKGKEAVLGYGIVTSGPKFSPTSEDDLQLYRDVLWIEKDIRLEIPKDLEKFFNDTVHLMKYKSFRRIFSGLTPRERHYWKIAPGVGAMYEKLWYERGIISVQWDEFLDNFDVLQSLDELGPFQDEMINIVESHRQKQDGPLWSKTYTTEKQIKASAEQFWRFFHGVKVGDMVVANRGISTILAVGEVVSGTYTDPSLEYPHVRDVKWLYTGLWVPKPDDIKGNWQKTIEPLTEDEYNRIMAIIPPPDPKLYATIENLLLHKRQVILYGPPGTGKTYHANKYISRSEPQSYDIDEKTLINQHLYVLVTYSSSYGHVPNLSEGDHFTYEWKGRHNWQRYFDEIQEGDIALVYYSNLQRMIHVVRCLSKGEDSLEFEIIRNFSGATYRQMKDSSALQDAPFLRATMSLSLAGISEQEFRHVLSLSGDVQFESLGLVQESITQRIPKQKFVTFHPSFGYEEFIEGLRPVTNEDGALTYRVEEGVFKAFSRNAFNMLLKKAGIKREWTDASGIPQLDDMEKAKVRDAIPQVPFYLIVDEINRGDIARIFGELITLLEADKRYSEENELVTQLPYSKQNFAIPPNLYLIGTMNTADRSISLVDIALRRRFGFIELMPDYAALRGLIAKNGKPEAREIADVAVSLLERINGRIVDKYDRDHQIGHSYFTRIHEAETRGEAIEGLHFAWYHEIIPLLQEYFYDAPRKLHDILGDSFVKVHHDGKGFSFQEPLEDEAFLTAIGKLAGSSVAPEPLSLDK